MIAAITTADWLPLLGFPAGAAASLTAIGLARLAGPRWSAWAQDVFTVALCWIVVGAEVVASSRAALFGTMHWFWAFAGITTMGLASAVSLFTVLELTTRGAYRHHR